MLSLLVSLVAREPVAGHGAECTSSQCRQRQAAHQWTNAHADHQAGADAQSIGALCRIFIGFFDIIAVYRVG